LTEETSYTGTDSHAVTYELAKDVLVDFVLPTSAAARREQTQTSTKLGRSGTVIRFQPDGFIGEGGPDAISFKPDPKTGRKVEPTDAVWVARTYNGLHYEIPTNQWLYVRR
jgi:hypothetical protein